MFPQYCMDGDVFPNGSHNIVYWNINCDIFYYACSIQEIFLQDIIKESMTRLVTNNCWGISHMNFQK